MGGEEGCLLLLVIEHYDLHNVLCDLGQVIFLCGPQFSHLYNGGTGLLDP